MAIIAARCIPAVKISRLRLSIPSRVMVGTYATIRAGGKENDSVIVVGSKFKHNVQHDRVFQDTIPARDAYGSGPSGKNATRRYFS